MLHYAFNGLPDRWAVPFDIVAFHHTDIIDGPVHTNETSVLICGKLTFNAQVETGGDSGDGSCKQVANSGCGVQQPSGKPKHTGQLLVNSYASKAACDTRSGVGSDGLTDGTQWLRDVVRRVKAGVRGWKQASTVDLDTLASDVDVVWSDGDLVLIAKGYVDRPVTLIASRDIVIKANNATQAGATYVHGADDKASLLEATGTDDNGRQNVLALIAGCDVRLQFDRAQNLKPPHEPPDPADPADPGAPWEGNCISPSPPPLDDNDCVVWQYHYQAKTITKVYGIINRSIPYLQAAALARLPTV